MGCSRAFHYACAFAAAVGLTSYVAHADLKKTDKIVGDWHIYSEIDSMTDKVNCAGFYKDDPFIQLSPGGLYFSYRGRGGWKSYKYRLGDGEPVSEYSGRYSSSDYISFTGKRFEQAVASPRIRLQVLTYIRGIIDEDVNLSEAQNALAAMSDLGCGK